jgi:hypothetical protein
VFLVFHKWFYMNKKPRGEIVKKRKREKESDTLSYV